MFFTAETLICFIAVGKSVYHLNIVNKTEEKIVKNVSKSNNRNF